MATNNPPEDHSKKLEEKLETALAFKEDGNTLYKAKEYKKAMRKYHNAILYMKGIDNDLHGTPAYLQAVSVDPNSKVKISEDLEKQCIKANIAIYNNLAACLLASSPAGSKTEVEYEKILKYLDIVLELDPENDKALYRKGQAFKHMKDFEKSKDIFEELVKIQTKKKQPIPKDVLEDIKNLSLILKNSEKQAKDMYANMFKSR